MAGAAAGAAQTLGSVFIVEGYPKSEWDARIGWFRFTFGLGQVAGLTIGAVFAESDVDRGWYVAGGVILLGVFLGRVRLPHLARERSGAATTARRSTAGPAGAGSCAARLGEPAARRFGARLVRGGDLQPEDVELALRSS